MFAIALIILAAGIPVSSLDECRDTAEEFDADAMIYYPGTHMCQIIVEDPEVQRPSN